MEEKVMLRAFGKFMPSFGRNPIMADFNLTT